MSDLWPGLLALPSPLPQVHVYVHHVVENAVDPRLHHAIENAASWVWPLAPSDLFLGLGVLATIFLGIAALATIIANDLSVQERTMPHCDLEQWNEFRVFSTHKGQQLGLGFTLRNDGTGPAREVRLHLLHFGGVNVGAEAYLGGIAPGTFRRHSPSFGNEALFDLPPRPGGYKENEPCFVLLTYYSMRGDLGDAYIEEHFPEPRSDPKRKRTTPPTPTRRGFGFLLWVALGLKKFRPTTSDNDLKAKREALRRSLDF